MLRTAQLLRSLLRILITTVAQSTQFVRLALSSRAALSAEVLFLRMQLALPGTPNFTSQAHRRRTVFFGVVVSILQLEEDVDDRQTGDSNRLCHVQAMALAPRAAPRTCGCSANRPCPRNRIRPLSESKMTHRSCLSFHFPSRTQWIHGYHLCPC
jgi:hypothetical protein